MEKICLLLYRSGDTYDISELAENIKWKGRKGAAARSLSVSLTDNANCKSNINVTEGNQLVFKYGKNELFRGMIMSQQQGNGRKMPVTAYDNGIYLSNNKDTFIYENKTVHDIFIDVCKRFGIKYSDVANTTYKIPNLTKSKTTAWDAIQDALSQDCKTTGERHYVMSSKGVLSLVKRREKILEYMLESGVNLISYSYKRSIENIKTRLKILSDEDTAAAFKKDSGLEKKIGIFQEIEQKDDNLSDAQLGDYINETLKEISAPEISLTAEAVGMPEAISGMGVYVRIPDINISSKFYIDEDTHTFKSGGHTMSLKLNAVNE